MYLFLLLFNCQGSIAFLQSRSLCESLSIISHLFPFVNTFLKSFLKIFQGFFTRFWAVRCFFAATSLLYHIFKHLSIPFLKVFLIFFKIFFVSTFALLVILASFLRQPQYYITSLPLCQYLLQKFFEKFQKSYLTQF